MGRNGAGKTTLLKCIMGLLPITGGKITLDNHDFSKEPAELRAQAGIAYIPQGREIFPLLSVEENLLIGLKSVKSNRNEVPDRIFELFPVLSEILDKKGGELSGGQQQQLAIARGLMIDPKILILDEPSEGLQPSLVKQIEELILELVSRDNLTVLLVEQKISFAKKVADEFRLMEKGRVVSSGSMSNLSEELVEKYLLV